MIKLKFYTEAAKLITKVGLKKHKQKQFRTYDAIFDPGSTMTTMSESLYNELGYKHNDPGKVRIIGINHESSGVSTLIDNFEIGGTNLGRLRIVVGQLHPKFENCIIIGMNVIIWYNFAINHHDKAITMVERKFKTSIMATRFTMKNILSINLASIEIDEIYSV